MQWLKLKVPPPLVTAIFAAAIGLVARYLPNVALPILLRIISSIITVAMALVLFVLAHREFHAAQTTINPFQPQQASALITDGIFRYSRNPIYLAFLLLLIGWALFLANLWALLLCPPFVLYLNHFQIQEEERALESHFGERYLDYKSRVRRWL